MAEKGGSEKGEKYKGKPGKIDFIKGSVCTFEVTSGMKKYELIFSPSVQNDTEDAVNYNKVQLWGLGNKFLTDLESTYKAIILTPFFASVKYDNIWCAALKKFPFSVHFMVNEKEKAATIISVFNTWKQPFW